MNHLSSQEYDKVWETDLGQLFATQHKRRKINRIVTHQQDSSRHNYTYHFRTADVFQVSETEPWLFLNFEVVDSV